MSNYLSIKNHVHISSTDGNIRDWLLLNCAFIISDITQSIVLQFCKPSKKTTFSVFLSCFLVKLSKFQFLKLNISRTALPILMILVLFCRIFERPFRWNQVILALQFFFKTLSERNKRLPMNNKSLAPKLTYLRKLSAPWQLAQTSLKGKFTWKTCWF